MELEFRSVAIVNADADDVRRQQVAGELHALERQIECRGQGVRQRGFADAGQVLDHKVSAGQQTGHGEPDLWTLAKYDIVDLLFGAGERRRQHIVEGTRRGVRHGCEARAGHGAEECMSSSIGNVNAAVMRTRAPSGRRRVVFLGGLAGYNWASTLRLQ